MCHPVPDECPSRLSALIVLIFTAQKSLLFLLEERPLVSVGEVAARGGGHVEVPLAEVGRAVMMTEGRWVF